MFILKSFIFKTIEGFFVFVGFNIEKNLGTLYNYKMRSEHW